MQNWIQELPKAELHVHLEGLTKPETMLELARRHNQWDVLPSKKAEDLQKWFAFSDFPHFLTIYMIIQDLMRTPEDFELLTYQCGEDMAEQNIRYREVTFTPYTHVDHQKKGLRIDDILFGLEAGRKRAKQDFGVEIRWVFDVSRNLSFPEEGSLRFDPEPGFKTLDYALKGRAFGVLALGLGGYEPTAPARFFKEVFAAAKEKGLPSVPHAGENAGPESVWEAIRDLQADRIGHGVRSIDDPELVQYLKRHEIVLEICPTSNLQLNVYADYASHPFKKLDAAGVIVTVNSDDPPLFNANLLHEYQVLSEKFAYPQKDIIRIARNAFAYSLAEEDLKASLLAGFDAWCAGEK